MACVYLFSPRAGLDEKVMLLAAFGSNGRDRWARTSAPATEPYAPP